MADTAHRKPKPLRAAIVYDFDGTLARGNLQERRLSPPIIFRAERLLGIAR